MRGENLEDQTENQNIIRIFRPNIIEILSGDIIQVTEHLFSMDVLNERDNQEIGVEYDKRGSVAASVMLLERLPRRKVDWFNTFIRVAQTCKLDGIVEMLTVPEYTRFRAFESKSLTFFNSHFCKCLMVLSL